MFNHKIISTKLSELSKIPHTVHTSTMGYPQGLFHKMSWATPRDLQPGTMGYPYGLSLKCYELPAWSDIQVSWPTPMVFHAIYMGYPHGLSNKFHGFPPGSYKQVSQRQLALYITQSSRLTWCLQPMSTVRRLTYQAIINCCLSHCQENRYHTPPIQPYQVKF